MKTLITFLILATAAHAQLGNATKLRGKPISPTAPTNGQALIYNSTTGQYEPGAAGGGTQTEYVYYRAARCQNTVAGAGFSTPSTNAPTPACVTGTNTLYGVLQFTDASTQSVQDQFELPASYTQIDLLGKWRTSATSGSAVWQLQTACVADAETGDPSWNTAQAITDAAKGTTLQFNDFSQSSITLTGCAAGEVMFFKFFRDPSHASDDLGATAELVDLRFKITR